LWAFCQQRVIEGGWVGVDFEETTAKYPLSADYLSSDSNLTLTGLSEGQHNLTVKAVSVQEKKSLFIIYY
jgi:hypothetical protein